MIERGASILGVMQIDGISTWVVLILSQKWLLSLEPVSQARYLQKLAVAGVTDPYDLSAHLFTPIEK